MLKRLLRRSDPCLPPGKRVYAVGDVHGRLDLLEALFEQIRTDDAARAPADTEGILLGDLIDRGPDSAGVVRWAMEADRGFARVSALKGNHEASLLSVLDDRLEWLDNWLNYGGVETLESWGLARQLIRRADGAELAAAARAIIPQEERAWLAALPTTRQIGDYLFVHAGVRPGVAIDKQVEQDLIWIRHEFLDSAADHGAFVVHGHTISEDVVVRGNRVGIDTGAYRSGRLTVLGVEGSERWFLST